jgi:hypothetical protein
MRQASGRTGDLERRAGRARRSGGAEVGDDERPELHAAVGAPGRVEQHRLAHEAGDELARRPLVEIGGRALLGDPAAVHDDDAVAHRERLALVVRDVGDRQAEPLLQGADLLAHRAAQARVEVRERLVEEQHRGLEDERAAPARRAAAGRPRARSAARIEASRPTPAIAARARSRASRFATPETSRP